MILNSNKGQIKALKLAMISPNNNQAINPCVFA